MFDFHGSVSSLFSSFAHPGQQGMLLYTTAQSLHTNPDDICWVFHKPVKTCFLIFCTLGSFQTTTALVLPPGILVLCYLQSCSHPRASNTPSEIPIQSGHNTCKKGKNRQLLILLSCSFTTYIHWKPVYQVCYIQTFKLNSSMKTLKTF